MTSARCSSVRQLPATLLSAWHHWLAVFAIVPDHYSWYWPLDPKFALFRQQEGHPAHKIFCFKTPGVAWDIVVVVIISGWVHCYATRHEKAIGMTPDMEGYRDLSYYLLRRSAFLSVVSTLLSSKSFYLSKMCTPMCRWMKSSTVEMAKRTYLPSAQNGFVYGRSLSAETAKVHNSYSTSVRLCLVRLRQCWLPVISLMTSFKGTGFSPDCIGHAYLLFYAWYLI